MNISENFRYNLGKGQIRVSVQFSEIFIYVSFEVLQNAQNAEMTLFLKRNQKRFKSKKAKKSWIKRYFEQTIESWIKRYF